MTSWRQQYDRMLRSFERLTAMAEGRQWADSNDATDALFHFFQDAYHLKDWIAGDPVLAQLRLDVEPLFSNDRLRRKKKPTTPAGPLVMQICADVCNGVKHFRERWNTQVHGVIARQDVTVFPGVAGGLSQIASAAHPVASGPGAPEHDWAIDADGTQYDALQVAQDVVVEWDRWLVNEGLLDAGEQHPPVGRRSLRGVHGD
jgi:hypothetical protein